ncbi:CDP-alcohol phosphatidyltransferase family protein [bacterium]|nr:CDP-alcohol phosphatidyltransferase family protein [bacterium]
MKIHLFESREPQCFYSVPNIITVLRLSCSLVFFVLAITQMNPTYNFIGFGIHWLGDFIDGFYARKFKQETILGAEIDIIADRVEILFFYVNFLYFRPYLFLPVVLYLIDYTFIDFYLSYQFIKYDIISPNYFYKVDKLVYLLNYSPGGKFCNSSIVTLLLIFLPQIQIVATIIAAILIGVKLFSIYLLNKKRLKTKRGDYLSL